MRLNRAECTGRESPPPSYEEVAASNIMSNATTLDIFAELGNETHYFIQEDHKIIVHEIHISEQVTARIEMNLARTLWRNRVESTGSETSPPSYEEAEAFDIMSTATTLEVYATHGNKIHYFVQKIPEEELLIKSLALNKD
ncbi:hypothetical protein CDAR_531241 [Caerostris darwini]|uniref:Uncharacterized protein n=1 Tax=Caerostris darwini TaxID=1538125 RepID=A0AAV4TYH4_9ARAC|nr:hypothetical protein CDAR_531241 [Caerostris darwini]